MAPVQRQILAMSTITGIALVVMLGYFFLPLPSVGLPLGTEDAAVARRAAAPGPDSFKSTQTRGFVDVTESSGLDARHQSADVLTDIRQVTGAGVCLADFDGDGRIDIFLVASVRASAPAESAVDLLYLNLGGMHFSATPLNRPYAAGEFGMGCVAGDYDGDGDQDVFVTALGPNRLYRNDGRGHFEEVAAAAGVADPRWSTAAALADYDRDGDLDLYVANYLRFEPASIPARVAPAYDRDEPPAFSPYVFRYEPDALFRNNGDGTFTEVTEAAGIVDNGGKGLGVAFADVSNDGWPDLIVVNDVSPNTFLPNTGAGTFVDRSVVSGLADPRSGMGISVGDYDQDGWFDLFLTHWQDESNVLFRNLGGTLPASETPLFEDVTQAAGLALPSIGSTGWGTCWADFDHDGDLDLLVVNGYTSPAPRDPRQCIGQAAMLFINTGGRFTNQAERHGLGGLSQWAARGAATADLDDDGDLDIVITTNNGPARLLENRMATGHWLKVQPDGQAVGALVRIVAARRMQQRLLLAGTSYMSSEPLIAHFGVGDATRIERVEVRWPDGTTRTLRDVRVDQTLSVHRE
ncbi:MAG TPA: CRTAC1 family protein [Phycisphaerae bacterium]